MKFERSELYYFSNTLNKKANQTTYSHTTLFNQSLVSDLAFSLGSYKKDEHTKKLIAKIKQSLKEKIFYIFIVVFWSYTQKQYGIQTKHQKTILRLEMKYLILERRHQAQWWPLTTTKPQNQNNKHAKNWDFPQLLPCS